ncbi:MAG: hypothetical protein ABF490_03810, partial [Lentilactobacillus hilgardii]|uniref:hypothetical protein n=1 Tax=Lentilactobacillus hilgardii TaxID=1588 RepID=UPI0039E757EE
TNSSNLPFSYILRVPFTPDPTMNVVIAILYVVINSFVAIGPYDVGRSSGIKCGKRVMVGVMLFMGQRC